MVGAELVEIPAVELKNPNCFIDLPGRLAENLNAVWAN